MQFIRLGAVPISQLHESCTELHLCRSNGAPGRIRTCDTGFRRAVLYPLSYEGGPRRSVVQECRCVVLGWRPHSASSGM